MASSSLTNAYLVDFESVLEIPDQEGMQKMFKALENSGLRGFLGCKPVLFLSEIVQFFETALVQDNDITGAISGKYFTITPSRFAGVFELPTEGISNFSDVPKNQIVSETVGSKKRPAVVGEEPVIAKKKREGKGKPPSSQASPISIAQGAVPLQMTNHCIAAPVDKPPASKRQSKRRIFVLPTVSEDEDEEDAVEGTVDKGVVPLQMIEPTIVAPVEKPPASKRQSKRRILVLPTVSEDEDEEDAVDGTVDKVSHVPAQVAPIMDDVDMIIGQVISESAGLSTNKTEQGDKHVDETDIGDDFDKWLDSSFPDFDSRVDEPVVASTNLEKAVSSTPNVEEADDSQSMDIQGTVEQTGGSTSKDVGEIVAPADSSKKSAEEHMSFDDILLQISNDMFLPSITAAEVTMIMLGEFSSIGDKGKAILVEDEQITENPASEIVALICRDVEVLVRVRDSVMKAVVDFFASFSLNTMPDMKSLKDLKEKEKLMMEWAETNTLATAVRRQIYLALDQPWTDMAVQVISLLSAAHSKSLEDFKAQQQEHKIEMVQPNSSLPVIDSIDHSGVRLAHFYSITKSICWVRPMVLIDEVWTPLQGSGYWRSNCKLSLFVDRKRLPESVVA
ncbi:putative phosphoserine phosphatase [Dorcoceras hygrometricum]|uniref:Putative phosphoserine phosphatase n=1 Tax=Dorcoceras hygrometricum TaxID=472368 RepID=A0A2Z7D7N5_9LAMI|nr:putative phosphoserine phosphatase [Dorcoceras hygrometricum]